MGSPFDGISTINFDIFVNITKQKYIIYTIYHNLNQNPISCILQVCLLFSTALITYLSKISHKNEMHFVMCGGSKYHEE